VVPNQKYAGTLVVRSSAPVDPRFADPRVREELRSRGSNYTGPDRTPFMTIEPTVSEVRPPPGSFNPIAAHEAVGLWRASTDRARSCQDVGMPPWYRFRDLTGSWQFAILNVAPGATLALFVAAAVTRRRRWFQVTCAAALATAVLTLALWSLV
jgi:hypothetical protein